MFVFTCSKKGRKIVFIFVSVIILKFFWGKHNIRSDLLGLLFSIYVGFVSEV